MRCRLRPIDHFPGREVQHDQGNCRAHFWYRDCFRLDGPGDSNGWNNFGDGHDEYNQLVVRSGAGSAPRMSTDGLFQAHALKQTEKDRLAAIPFQFSFNPQFFLNLIFCPKQFVLALPVARAGHKGMRKASVQHFSKHFFTNFAAHTYQREARWSQ
jgi:hypothetical protein